MALKITKTGKIKTVPAKDLRKLIDIPADTLPTLQEMADNNRQDLKNFIEFRLIQIAKTYKKSL